MAQAPFEATKDREGLFLGGKGVERQKIIRISNVRDVDMRRGHTVRVPCERI